MLISNGPWKLFHQFTCFRGKFCMFISVFNFKRKDTKQIKWERWLLNKKSATTVKAHSRAMLLDVPRWLNLFCLLSIHHYFSGWGDGWLWSWGWQQSVTASSCTFPSMWLVWVFKGWWDYFLFVCFGFCLVFWFLIFLMPL